MTGPLFLERPWALWLGLALTALVLFAAGPGPVALSPARRRAALLLRVLGVLLASVAAAGPRRDVAPDRPRQLLVAAAPDAGGGFPPPAPGEEVVLREAPGLPLAIARALGARDPEAAARLLCLLAGREGAPAGSAAALRAAAAAGLPGVAAPRRPGTGGSLPGPPPTPLPPLLEGLALPPGLAAGVPFHPRPLLAAGAEGVSVEIHVDGRTAGTWTAGSPAPELLLSAGPHLLAARALDGEGRERGTTTAVVTVPGPARVLLIEEGAAPSPLARALEVQGLPVTRAAPGGPPPDFSSFSVVALGEGAAGSGALEEAVRRGTGLLVLGHPVDSRGLGRLRGSPLASALPVFLPPPPPPAPPAPSPPEKPPAPDVPPAKEGPSVRVEEGERPGAVVSLFLVVDTSGSMAGIKLEMARRAAAAAAGTLDPRDRFGLLSFAGEPTWVVPPGPAGEEGRIAASLRALRAGGGTDLLPALREIHRAVAAERTAVRHVLVLSDGETSPFGLRKAVEDIVAAGGTLSTVGIGSDYDARLLGSLSNWGGGRTFPAVDPANLPRVVTMDARRIVEAGKEASRRGERDPDLTPPTPPERPPETPPERPPPEKPPGPIPVPLEAVDPCAVLEGLPPFHPALPPEAAPAARQSTTLALRFSGDGGPALVLGRHGLGRTAVLVADAAELAASPAFPAAAARIVRSLAAAPPAAPAVLRSVHPGEMGTRVAFELPAGSGGAAPVPRVEVLDAAGDGPAPAPVVRTGDRRFEVTVPGEGARWRTLVVRTGGAEGAGSPLGFFDPGSPPPDPADGDLPARVAALAGIPLLEGPLPPPPPGRPGAPMPSPAGPWLGVLAALLLLSDAALRRAGRG